MSDTEPIITPEYAPDSGTEILTFSPPEADACPTCNGSCRAWVHDAAGGYGTTCKSCDGTGVGA